MIPGVLHKTLKSVEYIIKKYEFDYLYRTNLSSFICLEKLYTFVSNNKLDYGGMLYHYDEHGGFPAHLKKEYKFSYASGSGFFMSNEACRNLIIMKNTLDMDIIDDVEIGSCLTKKYTILNIESNDTEKLDTTNCFHYILTSPESMTVMVTQHLESDIQKELGFLSIPYIKKINFLTKLLEDKEVKDREFFQKSLTNVRKESFCTCYDHFKNQIDSRIETPNIDVDNEEEYTKELSNIMGLLFKIKMV